MRQMPRDNLPKRSDSLAALRDLGYNAAPKSHVVMRGKAQSVSQIIDEATTLSQLQALARDGQNRLQSILPLLPVSLRSLVQAGGVDGETWHILVPNSAVAAKLRQCLPLIEQVLLDEGWARVALRVKVQTPER